MLPTVIRRNLSSSPHLLSSPPLAEDIELKKEVLANEWRRGGFPQEQLLLFLVPFVWGYIFHQRMKKLRTEHKQLFLKGIFFFHHKGDEFENSPVD